MKNAVLLTLILVFAAILLTVILLLKKADDRQVTQTHHHMRLFTSTLADKIGKNMTNIADGMVPLNKLREAGSLTDNPVDQWGTPYQIDVNKSGRNLTVKMRSAGSDRKFGSDDDLEHNHAYSQQ